MPFDRVQVLVWKNKDGDRNIGLNDDVSNRTEQTNQQIKLIWYPVLGWYQKKMLDWIQEIKKSDLIERNPARNITELLVEQRNVQLNVKQKNKHQTWDLLKICWIIHHNFFTYLVDKLGISQWHKKTHYFKVLYFPKPV